MRSQSTIKNHEAQQAIILEELGLTSSHQLLRDTQGLMQGQRLQATGAAQLVTQSFLSSLKDSHDKHSMQLFSPSILRWISSSKYKENLDDALEEIAEDITEWIFDHSTFVDLWRDKGADLDL
jgi:hypothetical protein